MRFALTHSHSLQRFSLCGQDGHPCRMRTSPSKASPKGTHDVAGLAVGFPLHGVEGLASELAAAGHAGETLHVEHLVHRGAPSAFANHVLPTAGTAPWRGQRGTGSKGPRGLQLSGHSGLSPKRRLPHLPIFSYQTGSEYIYHVLNCNPHPVKSGKEQLSLQSSR